MTDVAVRAAPERGRLAPIPAGRGALSTVFLIAGVGSIAAASVFRNLEARVAPWTFTRFGLGPARHLDGPYFLTMGTGIPIKFSITTQCGALLLAVPLLFAAALVVRSPNVSPLRAVFAVVACGLLLVTANQLRLVMIGACARWFGFQQGFPLGHLVIGSLFSLLAIASSVIGFLRTVRGRGRIPSDPDAIGNRDFADCRGVGVRAVRGRTLHSSCGFVDVFLAG